MVFSDAIGELDPPVFGQAVGSAGHRMHVEHEAPPFISAVPGTTDTGHRSAAEEGSG